MFTQAWTLKNIGTNTWSPGQSGYTLNMMGVDSLGTTRLVRTRCPHAYHPSATISSGQSVPPEDRLLQSEFHRPETSGSVRNIFQLNSAGGAYFGAAGESAGRRHERRLNQPI